MPKIGDVLTAALVSGNNTGMLTYTWKTGSSVLGTGEEYAVMPSDLGKTIFVEITSSIETGIRTSVITEAVTTDVKAEGILSIIANTLSGKVTVELSDPLQNNEVIIIAIYKDNKLLELRAIKQNESLTVSFSKLVDANTIKVMWWNEINIMQPKYEVFPLIKGGETWLD